jgi:hypothetical protein
MATTTRLARDRGVGDVGDEGVAVVTAIPEANRRRSKIAAKSPALTTITKMMSRPRRFDEGGDADAAEIGTRRFASPCRIDPPVVLIARATRSMMRTTMTELAKAALVATEPGAMRNWVTRKSVASVCRRGWKR